MNSLRILANRSLATLILAGVLASIANAHPGSGIAVDKEGCVFFIDSGSGLWKIDTAGKIAKIPGAAYHWLAMDAKNAFAKTRLPKERNSDMQAAGSNPTILLASDHPIVVGTDGNLYYPHKSGSGPLRMMKMTPAGATTALADIPAGKKGKLEWLCGLAVGPDGTLYYTEDTAIWKMNAKGEASLVATVTSPPGAKLVPGHTAAMGPMLRGLAVDAKGDVYVASSADGRLLKVTPDGKVATVLQVDSPWSPTAVAVHDGSIFVLEYLHTEGDNRLEWLPRVRKITADGKSAVIATTDQMPGARRS